MAETTYDEVLKASLNSKLLLYRQVISSFMIKFLCNVEDKSHLMMEIESCIKEKGMTQIQASELMGVSRPRISDVMRGRIDKFTIDALVDMLSRAGRKVAVTVEHAA